MAIANTPHISDVTDDDQHFVRDLVRRIVNADEVDDVEGRYEDEGRDVTLVVTLYSGDVYDVTVKER